LPRSQHEIAGLWDGIGHCAWYRRGAWRQDLDGAESRGRIDLQICCSRTNSRRMNNDKTTRVLVVDDEPQILRVLRRSLESNGYEVLTAPEAATALDVLRTTPLQMVITDLRMPDMDGVELCREIRKTSGMPILIISVKGEEETKVRALDAGADDYVTKPFGIEELMARVRALTRRVPAPDSSVLSIGDFRIEPDQRRVFVREKEVRLTPKEYELLAYF